MFTANDIFYTLEQAGTTAPADHVPALFCTGAGLDSESTTITHTETIRTTKRGRPINKTVVDNCFCYAWQLAISPTQAEIYRTPAEIIEVLQRICNAVKTYNKLHDTDAKYIIWVANFAHEYAFLKGYLWENFEVKKIFAKSNRDILYLQISDFVEIRESIGLFGHSLADIAKNWCSQDNQKLTGTFDYSLIRTYKTPLTDTEKAYMLHDVTTLAEMHRNAVKHYTQNNGVCVLPYTSSGFVRLKLKEYIRNDDDLTLEREHFNFTTRGKPAKDNIHYLKKRNWYSVADPFQWYICREFGYCGGLCGSNIELAGEILHDVTCADLTSDYPAQLSHRQYPAGRLHRERGDLNRRRAELEKAKKPYFAVIQIAHIKARTVHATISEHKIINKNPALYPKAGTPHNMTIYNGKIYEAHNIVICVNDVDLAAYRELYSFYGRVLSLWSFDGYARAPQWLLNAMWSDYEEKAILKSKGLSKTVNYFDCKRRVNSYYGVCATRQNDTLSAVDDNYNPCPEKQKTFADIRREFWLNPYLAFWCTSYARATLMHFLARYPDSIVQYDTDSLYYIDTGDGLPDALKEYNAKIEYKNSVIFREIENPEIFRSLGTWDFEDTYKNFCGMGAKKYIKEDENGIQTVIAGLPKNAIPREIVERGVNAPFEYYNPLIKYLQELDNNIIIEHLFAGKFASVYDDTKTPYFSEITDYRGETVKQLQCSYHAITPIDFTLSMSVEYIKHIIKRRG